MAMVRSSSNATRGVWRSEPFDHRPLYSSAEAMRARPANRSSRMIDWGRVAAAVRHIRRLPEIVRCYREAEDWRMVTSAYIGLSRLDLPVTLRLTDGVQYRLEEFYELETLWLIYFHSMYRPRRTDRVIVDAGANIGLFSCYAASRIPDCEVFAVEPFPATYSRLLENVRSNGLANRIHTFNTALGFSTGTATMVIAGGLRYCAVIFCTSPGVTAFTLAT